MSTDKKHILNAKREEVGKLKNGLTMGITALYERLSRDDEQLGESNSISNQKHFLEEYARNNGFGNIRHYTDDGYTGTNFNRPAFTEMLAEVERGTISVIIVKDMSRFGRNYLEVGYYTEVLFPNKKVRFIAINNAIDSINPSDNDFTPFLNIMNEWYAKDTSRKIKAIFKQRMEDGKRVSGSIPYGYRRIGEDKQTLHIDPPAAAVVKRIFDMACEGKSPTAIAEILTEEKVLIPSAYAKEFNPTNFHGEKYSDKYRWSGNTVGEILIRQEYLGHTVLGKWARESFKTKSKRKKSEDEYLVFPNTHEAIINQDVWDMVQKLRVRKPRKLSNGKPTHRLSGFVYCADCGARLSYSCSQYRIEQGQPLRDSDQTFQCSTYRNHQANKRCESHSITASALEEAIRCAIKTVMQAVLEDEEAFIRQVMSEWKNHHSKTASAAIDELKRAEARLAQLDELIMGVYEKSQSGVIPERQVARLINQYDGEQVKIEERISELRKIIGFEEAAKVNPSRFISLVKKYKDCTEVTDAMLREFIERIEVHKISLRHRGLKVQNIDVYFCHVGKVLQNEEISEEEFIAYAEAVSAERKRASARKSGKVRREKAKEERMTENDGHLYPQKPCAHCGGQFWPNNNRQIYCSRECGYEAYQARIKEKRFEEKGDHTFRQKNCTVCGSPFWPSNGQEVMCSEECKSKHRREKQLVYYHEHVSEKQKAKTQAERERLMEENEGHLIPKRICEYCGEEYWPTMHHQKYCCEDCGKKAYERMDKGRDPAEKEGHKFYKRVCMICGEEFWPNGSNSITCSPECQKERISQRDKQAYRAKQAVQTAVP